MVAFPRHQEFQNFTNLCRVHLTEFILRAEEPQQPIQLESQRTPKVVSPISSASPEYTLSARQILEEAVRLDAQSAGNWSQLAFVLIIDYFNQWNEAAISRDAAKHLLERAEAATRKALKIDPTLALAHLANGLVNRASGNQQQAIEAFDRAVQLDPNFARGYAEKAAQLILVGRPQDAVPLVEKAISLSPHDPSIHEFYWIEGQAYFVTRNYDAAIPWLQKAVQTRPNLWFTRAYLLSAYGLSGKNPDLRRAMEEYDELFPAYALDRIRKFYENASTSTDPAFQVSLQELYRGLRLIGFPDTSRLS